MQNEQIENMVPVAEENASPFELALMAKFSISKEEAQSRLANAQVSVTKSVNRNTGPRQNVAVIRELAIPYLINSKVYEVSAREMTDVLVALGAINHSNPKAIGDAMGDATGGLGLSSARKNGCKTYDLRTLKA